MFRYCAWQEVWEQQRWWQNGSVLQSCFRCPFPHLTPRLSSRCVRLSQDLLFWWPVSICSPLLILFGKLRLLNLVSSFTVLRSLGYAHLKLGAVSTIIWLCHCAPFSLEEGRQITFHKWNIWIIFGCCTHALSVWQKLPWWLLLRELTWNQDFKRLIFLYLASPWRGTT